jgi:hypothetical protein
VDDGELVGRRLSFLGSTATKEEKEDKEEEDVLE